MAKADYLSQNNDAFNAQIQLIMNIKQILLSLGIFGLAAAQALADNVTVPSFDTISLAPYSFDQLISDMMAFNTDPTTSGMLDDCTLSIMSENSSYPTAVFYVPDEFTPYSPNGWDDLQGNPSPRPTLPAGYSAFLSNETGDAISFPYNGTVVTPPTQTLTQGHWYFRYSATTIPSWQSLWGDAEPAFPISIYDFGRVYNTNSSPLTTWDGTQWTPSFPVVPSAAGVWIGPPPFAPVLGVDVSHFQNDAANNGTINWSAVTNAGKSFVFVKASQGTDRSDIYLAQNILGATRYGMLAAPYHLCGWGLGTTSSPIVLRDPTAEARFFLNIASAYIGNGYLPPILDVEANFDGKDPRYKNPTGMKLAQWVKSWIQCVQGNTGVTPVVYVHHAILEAGTLNSVHDTFPSVGLWVINWDNSPATNPWGKNSDPWDGNWRFKQYASDLSDPAGHCPGIPDTGGDSENELGPGADLDSFNGNLEQLTALTNYPPIVQFSGIGWTPLEPPTDGGFSFQIFSPILQSAIVQMSEDLNTWNDVQTVTFGFNRVAIFIDNTPISSSMRVYRVKY